MRTTEFADGEYYHIFNRGVGKKNIFLENRDYLRFLFLILFCQSKSSLDNIHRHLTIYEKRGDFGLKESEIAEIVNARQVSLVGFALMPNHFHLMLEQNQENGISSFMHRISTAYSKYFNLKYGQSGHLFQGAFKAVLIESNEQLLHVSAYIHRNPRELPQWKNKEQNYPWSSYRDYKEKNRWPRLLEQEVILEQFDDKQEYLKFLNSSPTKEDLFDAEL